MKRPVIFGALFVILDQILKLYFQLNFEGREVLISENWGFTYTVNYGLWVAPNISTVLIIVIQIIAVIVWVIIFLHIKKYYKSSSKRLLIDLSFGFFTVGIFGNMIDKILFGYIRDYFINPIAISNLADMCGGIAVILFVVEILIYPESRQIMKK